jgi:hypothetical protein
MHRSISLTFRGFEINPQEIEFMLSKPALLLGIKGQQIKQGFPGTFKRSAIKFGIDFPDNIRLAEMGPALITNLGGIEHINDVKNKVSPEFIEFDIVLGIKNSKEQEGGHISAEMICALNKLGATLSFQFL